MGRDVGSVAGFGYSGALVAVADVWTPENLQAFLENPRDFAPGTKMSFSGLKDAEDRANLIAYLDEGDWGVLNRKGEAVGPWAGSLSEEALLQGLRDMMKLRIYDARMLTAQRQGKTSFYMQHMGEEAVSCAFRKALEPGDMIATGTPSGVGYAMDPPRFLKDGDTVVCDISGIGTLSNTVRSV
mgnify:CR=1 FL=1